MIAGREHFGKGYRRALWRCW